MDIKWVRLAWADLDDVYEFIARDKPEAAGKTVRRILDAAQILADNPGAGRPGRVAGTRELIIAGTPFIVPYRVKNNAVEILRVLHSSRKWPQKL
jgi:plasmid stabilization system protein ParE